MSETPSRKPRHALSDTGPEATAGSVLPEQQASPSVEDRDAEGTAVVPRPSPAGDDRRVGPAPVEPLDDAPTRVLPVIPRPRGDGAVRPTAPAVAQPPEPFRPAPVRGVPTPAPGGTGLRLPELPATVRPVLPAVLGAATALLLALGVVAAVNGAPDPAPAPAPPPMTTP